MGYQNDVAAAVVFQASSQLRKVQKRYKGKDPTIRRQLWESAWEGGLLGDTMLEELVCEVEGSEKWKQAVSILPLQQQVITEFTELCRELGIFQARNFFRKALYLLGHF